MQLREHPRCACPRWHAGEQEEEAGWGEMPVCSRSKKPFCGLSFERGTWDCGLLLCIPWFMPWSRAAQALFRVRAGRQSGRQHTAAEPLMLQRMCTRISQLWAYFCDGFGCGMRGVHIERLPHPCVRLACTGCVPMHVCPLQCP